MDKETTFYLPQRCLPEGRVITCSPLMLLNTNQVPGWEEERNSWVSVQWVAHRVRWTAAFPCLWTGWRSRVPTLCQPLCRQLQSRVLELPWRGAPGVGFSGPLPHCGMLSKALGRGGCLLVCITGMRAHPSLRATVRNPRGPARTVPARRPVDGAQ